MKDLIQTYKLLVKALRAMLIFASLFVLFLNANSQTIVEVGGEISSQQWTNDFVYHVTSPLIINPGIELVIHKGVHVRFRQGTGMTVNGSLMVLGEEDGIVDSIYFQPLYVDPPFNWKWIGIQFSRVQAVGENVMNYARIDNARAGISISGDARNVVVMNSTVSNSQLYGIEITSSDHITIDGCRIVSSTGAGIYLQNSNNCLLNNNYISNNYDGIWMLASGTGNRTINNTITSNIIRNSNNINLFINSDSGGKCTNNLIENNFIENSFIGIQIGNPASQGSRNYVIGNRIITDKTVGIGLNIFQDSAVIMNNIFWKNRDGIILNRSTLVEVTNNSFYDNGDLENGVCIAVQSGSALPLIRHNTFTANGNVLIEVREPVIRGIDSNNFFKNRRVNNLIRNTNSLTIQVVNNYWGTTNPEVIAQLISGNINFQPFLEEPDIIAPMSPPQPAYKQVIGNQVRLTWRSNPEPDLAGYNVHYGSFRFYSFNNFTGAGADTVIVLDLVSIHDTLAITAYDTAATGISPQTSGNESPFSFPIHLPYAGPDTSICMDQTEYFITQSTYLGLYQTLTWQTSGDGTFNPQNSLWTVYYPGQADKLHGAALLTLQVVSDFVIYDDSFILSFRDFPSAFAGNDTILAADSSLFLTDAYAHNFDSVYWTSTGDGLFDDEFFLNPVYSPGEDDIVTGSVYLVLHAVSPCGIAIDTINVLIERRYFVEGRVWKDESPLNAGIVMAVMADAGSMKAEKFTPVLQNGAFRFQSLPIGNYIFYAIPDTLFHPHTLPGYYVNRRHWNDAYLLNLEANTYDLDLKLQTRQLILPPGIGKISGYFLIPEGDILERDVYCNDWFGRKEVSDICEGGVSNVTILLFNKSKTHILAHTLTDPNGDFLFSGLPFGDYIIDAEKPGYFTNQSPMLTLHPGQPEISDVVITMEPQHININNLGGKHALIQAEAFPNPANSWLSLRVDETTDEKYEIIVRNLLSQQVINLQNYSSRGQNEDIILINIENLGKGIYLGTIRSGDTFRSFRFVKN